MSSAGTRAERSVGKYAELEDDDSFVGAHVVADMSSQAYDVGASSSMSNQSPHFRNNAVAPAVSAPTVQHAADSDSDSEEEFDSPVDMLHEFSRQVFLLLIPITITVVITCWAVKTFEENSKNTPSGFSGLLVFDESTSTSSGSKFSGALLNALIIVGVIVLMTVVIVLLYKYHCTKIIWGWLMFTTFILLGGMGWYWLRLTIDVYNLNLDWVSAILFLWNFAAVGMLSIFWKSPRFIKQGYLVIVSAMMAWSLTKLPEWTTWVLLAAIAIYDIFAVLMPRGPLKVLVETAQKRGEQIPGLIYESAIYFIPLLLDMQAHEPNPMPPLSAAVPIPAQSAGASATPGTGIRMRKHNVKLGLGDFVFYSVLVGRAALVGATTAVVCYLVIIAGLCLTLLCLAIYRRALPALPFSIALGISFYFITTRLTLVYSYATSGQLLLM